tara:strand:+ start:164 stop:292 length:129 start_codon:yes stop_codon:yes gene_type:complete
MKIYAVDNNNGIITDLIKNFVIMLLGAIISNNQQGTTPIFAI